MWGWGCGEPERRSHCATNLVFGGAPGSGQRFLHGGGRQLDDVDVALAKRQQNHAPRMPHHNRGPGALHMRKDTFHRPMRGLRAIDGHRAAPAR